MAFNANYAIQYGREQGLTPEEIDSVLVKNGAKPVSSFRKFVEGPAIPLIGAGLGGAGGGLLAIGSGGLASPAIPFGLAGGAGTGTIVKHSLSDILGYTNNKFLSNESADSVMNNTVMGLAAGEGINLAGTMLSPFKTLTNIRNTSSRNTNLPENTKDTVAGKLLKDPFYRQSPTDVQNLAQSEMSGFNSRLKPNNSWQTGSKDPYVSSQWNMTTQVPKSGATYSPKDVWSDLKPFEVTGGVKYKGGTDPLTNARTLVSSVWRDQLNQSVPFTARTANNVMHFINENKKLLAGLGIGTVGGLGGVLTLLNAFKKK